MTSGSPRLQTSLGPLVLRSPIVAASGTVGSVVDFAGGGDFQPYGAAVAKSVSSDPWPGRVPPRLTSAGAGMLNGIGIQNPGIEAWIREVGPRIGEVPVPIWGSAVGHDAAGFAEVATGLQTAGVAAVEVNLSCPNLEDGHLFALDPDSSAEVVRAVREATDLPIGAKLSPNVVDIAGIADAVSEAGADWVVLTNTVWGAGIDVETRRPKLSGMVGGYSGTPAEADRSALCVGGLAVAARSPDRRLRRRAHRRGRCGISSWRGPALWRSALHTSPNRGSEAESSRSWSDT